MSNGLGRLSSRIVIWNVPRHFNHEQNEHLESLLRAAKKENIFALQGTPIGTGDVMIDGLEELLTDLGLGMVLNAQWPPDHELETQNSDISAQPIEILKLSTRPMNALMNAGIVSVGELAALGTNDLLRLPNMGRISITEVKEQLEQHGIQMDREPARTEIRHPNIPLDLEAAPIESLDFSVRTYNCLNKAGIETIGELMRWSETRLLSLKNMGRKSVNEIREQIESIDLFSAPTLATDVHQPLGQSEGSAATFPLATLLRIEEAELASNLSRTLINQKITTVHALAKLSFLELTERFDGNPADARSIQLWLHGLGLGLGMCLPGYLDLHFEDILEAFHEDKCELADKVSVVKDREQHTVSAERPLCVKPTCLDDEIERILESARSDKHKAVIRQYLGWDGSTGTTLEQTGQAFQVTRERVRQIVLQVLTWAKPVPTVFTEKALVFVANLVPVLANEAEMALVRAGIVKSAFRLESLIATAKALGLNVPWRIQSIDGQRIVTDSNSEIRSKFKGFLSEAQRRISHHGATTMSELEAHCSLDTSKEVLEAFCDRLEDFHWLDEAKEWFWLPTTRNALLNRLSKVLTVVPNLSLEHAHAAVLRDRRMRGVSLPIEIFRRLCEVQPWCGVSEGRVQATSDLPEAEEDESAELILAELLRKHGPVMTAYQLHALAKERGISRASFGALLSAGNLLVQHGRGIVGLVGTDVEQFRQHELLFSEDLEHAAEENVSAQMQEESSESILRGCEPTSASFHRDVARAIIRASTHLRKGGLWSLAELCFSAGDFCLLEKWSDVGLSPPSYKSTGFVPSAVEIDDSEAIALLFLLFCAHVTRARGTEGEIWPLIEKSLNEDLRAFFFQVRSIPKFRLRESTERVCTKLKIRNLFGREGEYSWLRTVFLQFGITRRGLHRLPAWLGQSSILPVSVEDLLYSDTLRAESFGDLWRTLQRYRAGQMTRAAAARDLRNSPWVDQLDLGTILDAAVERYGPQHDDWETKRKGFEDPDTLFEPPTFSWEGPEPQFHMALNSRSKWLTEARYAITLSPSKLRLPVVRTNQDYRIDSQDGLVRIDLSASNIEVDLLFRQKSSLAGPIHVSLLPQGCEYIFYELGSGKALPIGTGSVRPNQAYALLTRNQLDVTHEPPELRRVFGGNWVARAYRTGIPPDFLIRRGEVVVWENFQTDSRNIEEPVVLAEGSCSGGRWGEKAMVTIKLTVTELAPEVLIFGEQRLTLKRSDNDRFSCWMTLEPGVNYEKSTARVECRYRNRLRWLTVKLNFGPVEGTAIEMEDGWRMLRPEQDLDSDYLRRHRIYTKMPGVFDGDRVSPAEWVWLEGTHFCGRPRNTPSFFGETAYAVGEPLWLAVGPYNRPKPGQKLAASIVNSGVLTSVTFKAGTWELRFRQSLEIDQDYEFWIWETAVAQPRCLSKSEWLYDDGLCVIGSHGEVTPLSFAVSYQGYWLGAKPIAPGWEGYAKLIAETQDWPSTARWLKWWRVPVLHEQIRSATCLAVDKFPLESLQSWLLRGQLAKNARFSEEFEDAWLLVCRQLLWEWQPRGEESAQLLRSIGARDGGISIEWSELWDDLGELLNVNPLLLVRICSEGLAMLCPDANGLDRLIMSKKLRNHILGISPYSPETHVSEALINAHAEAANAMAVDDRFVSRSLVVDAISLYSGKLHQHHNLRIAISNSQAVRTHLAATILQKVIDGEL